MDKLSLAVIYTPYMEKFLLPLLDEFAEQCTFTTFSSETQRYTMECFLSMNGKVDAFLVNGLVTATILRRQFPEYSDSIIDFDVDYLSYYQALLKLMLKNRTLDFDRVYVDFIGSMNKEKLAVMLLEDRFIESTQSYVAKTRQLPLEEITTVKRQLLDGILKAWNAGEIDCVVTLFSTIIADMEENGIPYEFVCPDKNFIHQTLQKAINEVSLRKMQGSLPAVIQINGEKVFNDNNSPAYKLSQVELQKALMEFSKECCADFSVLDNFYGFEVITNAAVVRRITNNFTLCELKTYLEKKLNRHVCIGYGIGSELVRARLNAANANREAVTSVIQSSFLINEQGKLIGPLCGDGGFTLTIIPDEQIVQRAKSAGISPLTLQKILQTAASVNSEAVTAQILSEKLGITTRSANRFLAKLEACGQAQRNGLAQSKTRGRPERSYHIF